MTRSWRTLELFLQDPARLVQLWSPETEQDQIKRQLTIMNFCVDLLLL